MRIPVFCAPGGVQNRPVQSNPVALSRTQSNQSDPEDGTEANEGNEAIRSRPGLASRQSPFVTFVTFCSNPRLAAARCAVFMQLGPNQRQPVKPVALSRTRSSQSQQSNLLEMEVKSSHGSTDLVGPRATTAGWRRALGNLSKSVIPKSGHRSLISHPQRCAGLSTA